MTPSALAHALPPLLRTQAFGRALRAPAACPSTNTLAMAWAREGAPHGAVVTTDHQDAGRGRLGRAWHDAPGQNLLASIVLRPTIPAEAFGLIPIAAALAVAEVVDAFVSPSPVAIKWPNDVLIDEHKVCGMLLEASFGARPLVVLGIGLNVQQTEFPEALGQPTSLALAAGRPVPRAPVLAALLGALEARWTELEAGASGALVEAYHARMAQRGRPVVLRRTETSAPVEGVVLGIDPGGALRLDTGAGEEIFHAGDLTSQLPTP